MASWQEEMPGIDFTKRRQWFLDRLKGLEAAGSITMCAIDPSGVILGFFSVDPSTAYLDQLAVAPCAKGSGVASFLLTEAGKVSPHGIILDVNEDNARALAFYERQGFVRIGEGVNPLSGLKTLQLRRPGQA
ncbi:MAG: GNAT family N-acetyltransferase [Methylocapsa sp.]|nr:GNAT family N-acetyltransferase [Methylocapsa sp.]